MNNFNKKDILNQLGTKVPRTSSGLKFLATFLLGVAPLIIELILIEWTGGEIRGTEYEFNITWIWLIGFFTFLGSGFLSFILTKTTPEIKFDIIVPTLTLSFTSMLIFSTWETLEWYLIVIIAISSLIFMRGIFSFLLLVIIGVFAFSKMRKEFGKIQRGEIDPNSIFNQNPEAFDAIKNYMEQIKNKSNQNKYKEKEDNDEDDEDEKEDEVIDI